MSVKGKMRILDNYSDQQERELKQRLTKAYKRALEETTQEFSKVYQKYATGGKLTYTEMQKYGRLENLMQGIRKRFYELYEGNESIIVENLENLFERNYYYTGYIMETEAQMKLAFSMLDDEAIKRAIMNPISGLTLPERLEKNRDQIIIKTREELTQGLIKGESYDKQAKRIKDVYEGDINKAQTIVQTENNRVRNEAKQASYDHAKKKGLNFDKVWVATLDKDTRMEHAMLDGKKADEDGFFHMSGAKAEYPGGFGVARLDINCRCTTRVEFKNLPPESRKARESGQNKIIDYTTYENWKENRVF